MQGEKRIIFNSATGDAIGNKHAHFKNSLFDTKYLNPLKNHSIAPRLIHMDLNFKNPICPLDNTFPSLICVPIAHLYRKSEHKYNPAGDFKLQFFFNIHKYYLNKTKKYTILSLFNEWSRKETIAETYSLKLFLFFDCFF